MSYFLFICLFSFLLFRSDHASVRYEPVVLSNFDNNDISYVLLKQTFKGNMYAFVIAEPPNTKNKKFITVRTSSDYAKTWTDKSKINTSSDAIKIFSTYNFGDEIFVIYSSGDETYMAISSDGTNWNSRALRDVNVSKYNPIYFRGNAIDFSEEDRDILFICYREHAVNTNYKLKKMVGKCFLSYDKGEKWSAGVGVYISDYLAGAIAIASFFFNGTLFFKIVQQQNFDFLRCPLLINGDFHCSYYSMESDLIEYQIMDMDSINDFLVVITDKSIYGSTDSYTIATSYDGDNFLFDPTPIPKDINHEVISVDEDTAALLYTSKDKKIYSIKISGIRKRKSGCEFVPSGKMNEKYLHVFKKDINGVYSCKLNFLEVDNSEDQLYKVFYINVKRHIKFAPNCFHHSFIDADMQNDYTIIIKMSNKINPNELHEVTFFLPRRTSEYMFNGMSIMCYSLDKKYKITFVFNNIKNIVVPNMNISNVDLSVRAGEVLQLISCENERQGNLNLPVGSYILNSTMKESQYLISVVIDKSYNVSLTCSQQNINFSFIKGGEGDIFEGIDFTNVSPNYRHIDVDTNQIRIIEIIVTDFSTEQTLGLICPYESVESFKCFDEVYNMNDNLMSIENLFGDEAIFASPKRILFHSGRDSVESTLHLDSAAISVLSKSDVLFFKCKCKINKKSVFIRFILSATRDEKYIKNQFLKNVKDEKLDDDKEDEAETSNKNGSFNHFFAFPFLAIIVLVLTPFLK